MKKAYHLGSPWGTILVFTCCPNQLARISRESWTKTVHSKLIVYLSILAWSSSDMAEVYGKGRQCRLATDCLQPQKISRMLSVVE